MSINRTNSTTGVELQNRAESATPHEAAPPPASGSPTQNATITENRKTLSSKFFSFMSRVSCALIGSPSPLKGRVKQLPTGTPPTIGEAKMAALLNNPDFKRAFHPKTDPTPKKPG